MGVCFGLRKIVDSVSKSIKSAIEFIQIVAEKEISPKGKFIGLLIIKYMYMLLTYVALHGRMYVPDVSYGVGFVWWKELIASVVFAVMTFFYTKLHFSKKFVSNVVYLLYVLSYIPMNSAFSLNDASFGFFILSTFYYIAFIVAVYEGDYLSRRISKKWNERKVVKYAGKVPAIQTLERRCSYHDFYVRVFCVAICLLLIIHKIAYNGLNFTLSISSDSVYANRSSYREYTLSISGTPIAYVISIVRNLASIVMPFYTLVSLIRRRPIGVVIGVLSIFFMYSISNQKANLFSLIVAVALYLCYRLKILKSFQKLFTIGIIVYMCMCFVEMLFGDSFSTMYRLLARREMYLPARIATNYYDFFSQNEKLFWRQEAFLLKMFIEPVYDTSVLTLINNNYYAGQVPSPNTGMFAEAYMHFGVAGIVIYPVLLSAIINLLEKVYRPFGTTTGILIAALLSLSLVNVPIVWTETVLGQFLFAFVLWVTTIVPIPRPQKKIFDLF